MDNIDKLRMQQGADTADVWLRAVVASIDDVFGAGYASSNPALVAAMLAASASDFRTTSWSAALDRLTEAVDAMGVRTG